MKATAKRPCREIPRLQRSWPEVFSHSRIITDPKRLAQLHAEVEKRKLSAEVARKAIK